MTHNVTRNVTVTQNHAIEEDIDKDIEEDIKEIDKESFRILQLLILERFRFWKPAWKNRTVKTWFVDDRCFAIIVGTIPLNQGSGSDLTERFVPLAYLRRRHK